MASRPALIVVSGPPGSGKTTLAHQLALAVGCPAICRDEIKEGMAHATPGFVPGLADELAKLANSTFFAALELLLRAGATTVAEAAFQDRLWRPGLEPLLGLADTRIVHCRVAAEVAFERSLRCREENQLRRAHPDPGPGERAAQVRRHQEFDRVSVAAPWIEVDTTDGYRPGLARIAAFAADGG